MQDLTLTETVLSSSTPNNVVSTPTKRWLATALPFRQPACGLCLVKHL